MMNRVFVGFGFGPIQAGLFAKEAADSRGFAQIVVSEVDAALVAAVRNNHNSYWVNIATATGIEQVRVEGVTLLNPAVAADAAALRTALSVATEIATSLPSVEFYDKGDQQSVAQLIAEGLCNRNGQTIVYTAENNNHAAEILHQCVMQTVPDTKNTRPWQPLNTVIGKMSQVIGDPREIEQRALVQITPGFPRAFIVEEFNRILISKIDLPDFKPAIQAFEEKNDLLPFEEAKLYGHNAIHTLLGFLAQERGLVKLSDARDHADLMDCGHNAFIHEAGAALTTRYQQHGDPLFTTAGFKKYAEDLLARMTNPYLADTVARATRDPLRKLGFSDRLFGTIRMCLAYKLQPCNLARGALAGLRLLAFEHPSVLGIGAEALRSGRQLSMSELDACLTTLWGTDTSATQERQTLARLLEQNTADT